MTSGLPSTPTRAGELSAAAATQWGDREFVRLGDSAITFAQAHHWTDVIAAEMIAAGVTPGDRVMIFMVNRLEVLAATLAAWRIGAIAAPVVAIYRRHELREIVSDLRPNAVFTAPTLADRDLPAEIDACLNGTGIAPAIKFIVDESDRHDHSWRVLPTVDAAADTKAGGADSALFASDPSAECLRLYTSGSTSAPKGVKLSSTAVILGGRQFYDRLGVDKEHVGLALAPVAHIAGLLASCIVPLTCGARAVVLPKWNVEEAVAVIDRQKVTWSLGAAVFLKDLVEYYEAHSSDSLHVLQHFVSGGANTDPDLIGRADALGMWAARTYGMTEAAGVIALAPKDATVERRSRWDGLLAANARARIIDDAGMELPPETEGRITVRGTQILSGYTDDAANSTQFDDEGWFDTGDIGLITSDNWMRVTGRTKDIINRGGEKFSAADIENVIHRHPAVAKAAVVGVPHERLGETVCAFVELRGDQIYTDSELRQFMESQDVARAKIPTEWHFVPEIPTTASGKIQKHVLRSQREHTVTLS